MIYVPLKELESKYIFDPWSCGQPSHLLGVVYSKESKDVKRYDKKTDKTYYALEPIKEYKYCMDCFEIRKEERSCVRCEKPFIPGCNVRFTCKNCHEFNKRSDVSQRGLK